MNINQRTTNPGEMRTQVTVQSRTMASNAGGFLEPVWSNVATVWCRWTNVHGAEAWQAASIQAVDSATVLMRYRSGIDTTCALLKGGVRYEIVSVDNIQDRGWYLELKVRRMEAG